MIRVASWIAGATRSQIPGLIVIAALMATADPIPVDARPSTLDPSDTKRPEPPAYSHGRLSADLPGALQETLEREMGTKTWEDGQRIQGPHEVARGLYFIKSGGVRFTNVLPDGRDVETGRLSEGDWFGHISLLSGLPPPHEAFAVGRTLIAMLPSERFHAMIAQEPQFSASLLRHLALNVHQLFAVLDGLRSLSSRARLARLLLILEDRREEGGRIEIDHEALASQVGLTRVTVGKILRDLAKAGMIRQGYGWIEVVDSVALSQE